MICQEWPQTSAIDRGFFTLQDVLPQRIPLDIVISRSPGMKKVKEAIQIAQASDINVLIQGETGTGKELVARIIHSQSQFSSGPFIHIHLPAVPFTLFEATLFGHERGAFTGADVSRLGCFEAAHQGSLFLDEIGDIPIDIQAKLLQAVERKRIKRIGSNQEKLLNIRIISASNKDLKWMIKNRIFRNDLYFRLKPIHIIIPPLRERHEDMADLVEHILTRLAFRYGKKKPLLSIKLLKTIQSYHWPGNVRELEGLLSLAILTPREKVVEVIEGLLLSPEYRIDCLNSYDSAIREFAKSMIQKALERSDYNISQAAYFLQMPRTTLLRKINSLGIQTKK